MFQQAEQEQKIVGLHGKASDHAEDFLIDNPDHHPFVVVVPILPHMLSADLLHIMIFTRARDGMTAVGMAPIIWEKYIKDDYPRIFPPTSDYTGQPSCKALDEGDWIYNYRECLKRFKGDQQRYPMVALGRPTFPHTFSPVNLLLEDFKDMCSFQVDNRTNVT